VRDAEDRPIVLGLRRGEAAAFDAAYAKYRARIYAFLLRLAGRRDVAEDLLQETWLKLARSAARLDEETDLAAWLFTVARNEAVSHRRWSLLDLSRIVVWGDEAAATAATPAPDERTDASRRVERLEAALARLTTAHREVLLLIAVEGFAHDEAAAILGLRRDALRQRLSRARKELASALEERHGHAWTRLGRGDAR